MMVVAIIDILDGEEIIIYFGKDYLKKGTCLYKKYTGGQADSLLEELETAGARLTHHGSRLLACLDQLPATNAVQVSGVLEISLYRQLPTSE